MTKHHDKQVEKIQSRRVDYDLRRSDDPSRKRPGSMNPKKQA